MNAPIRIGDWHASDRQFLRQIKTATRAQLKAMLVVFTNLNHSAFAWKRAAVERKLGINRTSFGWVAREEWWLEP
jgi:hypothetical protein